MLAALLSTTVLLTAFDPPPRFERLPNGLRVVIVEDHALPLVSVQLWYRAGSAYDAPERPGLCHVVRTLLEHRDDAAIRLRAAGVRFDSRTLRDACYFASVLPPNFLEYVLKIEAGRMRALKVTPESVAQGLRVAAGDHGVHRDNPDQRAERRLLAAMFPNHPYQHPPEFVGQTLKDLTPVEVEEFLQRWLVPGNATLFVIGAVSTVRTLELVRQHFGSLPWREPPLGASSRQPPAEQIHIRTSPADRPGVIMAWLTPAWGYFENAAIDVLMHRLCNPIDGPLAKRLESLGCLRPRWERRPWREAGLLRMTVEGEPREGEAFRRAEVEQAILDEIGRAATARPTPIELNRAAALARRDALDRRAAFGWRAVHLAAHEVIGPDLLTAEFELGRFDRVAVGDVQAAARRLGEARRVVAHQFVSEDAARGDGAARPPSLLPTPAFEPAQAARGRRRAKRPAGDDDAVPVLPIDSPPRVVRHELSNGTWIAVCELHGAGPAEVRTVLDWPNVDMLSVTPTPRAETAGLCRDYFSYHGLSFLTRPRRDRMVWAGHGPPGYIPQLLEWQQCVMRATPAAARATRHGRVGVVVVGDTQAAEVVAAVERLWGHHPPPGEPAGRTNRERRPAVGDAQGQNATSPVIHWRPADDGGRRRTVSISVVVRLRQAATGERCDLKLRAGARLLSELAGSSADSAHWACSVTQGVGWYADASLPAARLEAALQGFLGAVERVRSGDVPGESVETALRRARVVRLTSLESPACVADRLERGAKNPWDIETDVTADDCILFLRDAMRHAALTIAVEGGEESLGKILKRLGTLVKQPPLPPAGTTRASAGRNTAGGRACGRPLLRGCGGL